MNNIFKFFTMCLLGVSAISVEANNPELVKKGEYVARAANCMACHTSNPDKPFTGNYEFTTPFGSLYSSNITPSKQFGIGNWSEQEFIQALKKGIGKNGQHLYPAMPYDNYAQMNDADAKALYAYFMSEKVKSVDTQTKPKQMSFPFNVRTLMSGWNLFFLSDKPFEKKPDENLTVSRGRYLVDALGHCGACHTPRNILMAQQASTNYLSGADLSGWHAPNITSDKNSGIGNWTEDELVSYLRFGRVEGKGQAMGGMAEVIESSTKYLSDADLKAIAIYLKQTPPINDPKQTKPRSSYGSNVPLDQSKATEFFAEVAKSEQDHKEVTLNPSNLSTVSGIQLYNNACASCHQANGAGLKNQYYPSLFNNTTVGSINPSNLVMVILEGIKKGEGKDATLMPGFASDMNDEQIAAVSNFVLQTYGNPDAKVTPKLVDDLRKGQPSNIGAILITAFWIGVIVVLLGLGFLIRKFFFRRR